MTDKKQEQLEIVGTSALDKYMNKAYEETKKRVWFFEKKEHFPVHKDDSYGYWVNFIRIPSQSWLSIGMLKGTIEDALYYGQNVTLKIHSLYRANLNGHQIEGFPKVDFIQKYEKGEYLVIFSIEGNLIHNYK